MVQSIQTAVRKHKYDVVIIGAGFGGMYALYRLRQLGLRVKCFEAGDSVGGTWYWNRYPGARVDLESMVYSYSFSEELQQEWHWPEHFSPQEDIERYANHVADRFDLRKDIEFENRVLSAEYDESTDQWLIETERGSCSASFLVSASGATNATFIPDFPGAASFKGKWYHTSKWPKEAVDFKDKRVGIIGTGSSGIQVISAVAETAKHLYVFQRTANFSVPSRNRPLDPDYEREYKEHYAERRKMMMSTESLAVLRGVANRSVLDVSDEEREQILEEAWNARSGFGFMNCFNDIRTNLESNNLVAEFVRRKIRSIVKDPEVAELLCPKTHPIGTKRLCMDTGYFETFNRDNVTLVDVKTNPIVEITPTGLRTTEASYNFDTLIYATGFDGVTGNMMRIDFTGVGGIKLEERWKEGPRAYLGLAMNSFPNLFMIHGPGSPGVLAAMILGAEWQSNWIADLIEYMRTHRYRRVEPTIDAEHFWDEQVRNAVESSLYRLATDSWYMGANIPGKPKVFMVYVGGFDRYAEQCNKVAENDYEGFVFSGTEARKR